MPKLHPTAITNYLTHAGIPRTQGLQRGFRVSRTDQNDRLTVEWVLGMEAVRWRKEVVKQHVHLYLLRVQRVLSERYTVTEHEADTGWGGLYLRVQVKPGADLSEAQQVALEAVRAGGVVYRYRPLTPSVRRPKRVTSKELTPVFSHGLRAGTVLALERRGLVRLVPVTPEHGRVVVVEG